MFKRVVVIAPTRSTCVNLSHLIGLDDLPPTLLFRECGDELSRAIEELPFGGFGVVAGTGTGKSAAIRYICKNVVDGDVNVGIVTMEHRRSSWHARCNVMVVTPGVAMLWAENGSLSPEDLIVIDEIHQTSEQLELSMALLERGCTFVWMSATVNPRVYQEYFDSRHVIHCEVVDETRQASVYQTNACSADDFLSQNLESLAARQRGVAVFVPTRDAAEQIARKYNGMYGVRVDFYHGGEPAEKLREYVEGVQRPFVIAMTAAGSSSLNIVGLDTLVIEDKEYLDKVSKKGRRHRTSQPLSNNMLLQMIGRLNGRVEGGEVYTISSRVIDPKMIEPEVPEFKLGGSLELLVLAAASCRANVSDLKLIGSYDEEEYQKTFERFVSRGLVQYRSGVPVLTDLGRKVRRLPVSPSWGEILVKAEGLVDDYRLLYVLCLAACGGELYAVTGRQWYSGNDDLTIHGSEHLTIYNIVSEALRQFGELKQGARDYQLPGPFFGAWCKERKYSRKEILNTIRLFSSLAEQLKMKLPQPHDFPKVSTNDYYHDSFVEVLAEVGSMDYVFQNTYNGEHVGGNSGRGVTDGASVLGDIRYWKNSRGQLRATIEGTTIPLELVYRLAVKRPNRVVGVDAEIALVECGLIYLGQEIGVSEQTLPLSEVPVELVAIWREQNKKAIETLAQLQELRQTAAVLRQEVDRLSRQYTDVFSWRLKHQLEIHEELPFAAASVTEWQNWIEDATRAVQQARAVTVEHQRSRAAVAVPSGEQPEQVTDNMVSALRAHFGR